MNGKSFVSQGCPTLENDARDVAVDTLHRMLKGPFKRQPLAVHPEGHVRMLVGQRLVVQHTAEGSSIQIENIFEPPA